MDRNEFIKELRSPKIMFVPATKRELVLELLNLCAKAADELEKDSKPLDPEQERRWAEYVEKRVDSSCSTADNGDCISDVKCMHTPFDGD